MVLRNRHMHYGWMIVMAAAFVGAITSTFRLAFGIFLDPLTEEFGWTRSATSLAYSIQYIVFGVSSLFVGRLTDRWGIRRVVVVATCLFTVSMLLTARIQAMWQLYIYYGVLMGIAASGFLAPLHATISRWFIQKLGVALGIVVAIQAAGPLVLAPLVRYMLTVFRWEHAFIITGVVGGAAVIAAGLLVRNRPEDIGLKPYGADTLAPHTPASSVRIPAATLDAAWQRAKRQPAFRLLPTVHLLGCIGHSLPLVHVVSMATAAGLTGVLASGILGLASGFSVISRFGMAVVADHFGGRRALAFTLILQSLGVLILLAAPSATWLYYAFAFVFGVGYGGEMVVFPILNRTHFEDRVVGSVYGYQIFGAGVGMAIGGFLGGFLYDLSGSYVTGIWLAVLAGWMGAWTVLRLPPAVSQSLEGAAAPAAVR